jgi:hypothetical protein
MARTDLLALTEDDLALLSNRGIVKRARREFDSGEFTATVTESADGDVTVEWSDPATVVLFANRKLIDAKCSVPSAGLSRQVIRSVFAYQAHAGATPSQTPAESAPATITDPGQLADDVLVAQSSAQTMKRATAILREGHPVVLRRGTKPTAHFPLLSLAVRYAVAGDLRYAACECAEAQPCVHAVAGALAFRLLRTGLESGLVFDEAAAPAPMEPMRGIDAVVHSLIDFGFGTIPDAMVDRFRRAESTLDDAGLPWPAGIVGELVEEYDRYTKHDSRFDPRRVAELVGELCARHDAAAAGGRVLPRAFSVGLPQAFAAAESSVAQYVGLGTEANPLKGAAEVVTYLQHRTTGSVLCMEKSWADPVPDPAKPTPLPSFARLARNTIVKGMNWHSLGSGTMTIKGGKRNAAGRLTLGRTPAVTQPDGLRWESLRPTVLMEDIADAIARLASLPPALLGPRRRAESVLVLPVQKMEGFHFDPREHAVVAEFRDSNGATALLRHPWTSRARQGSAILIQRLNEGPPRWVSAHAHLAGGKLHLRPIALVFENADGQRHMVQPWVDAPESGNDAEADDIGTAMQEETGSAIHRLAAQILDESGDLMILGLRQANTRKAQDWRRLATAADQLGLAHLPATLNRVAEAIEQLSAQVRRDTTAATEALLVATVQALFLHRG